jgi:hypothetical protein
MSTRTTDDVVGPVVVPPPPITIPEDVLHTAERLAVADQLPRVIALTREVFGDAFALSVVEDPELDDWTHIVMDAEVNGQSEEVLQKHKTWCRSMVRLNLSQWFVLVMHSADAR